MLDNKKDVQQFLILQKKNELELRAICEGMDLTTEGTKAELIDRLINMNVVSQTSVVVAQALPLRTKDGNGHTIEEATVAMREWRKMIFEATNNLKPFKLLNGKGKSYTASLRFIKCSTETLQSIAKKGWILPLGKHKDVINLVMQEPEAFDAHIVQKPDARGNSWLMLHVAAKE